jgi:hypothetical protein
LHQRGFVHGDIRGFNTVFSDDEGSSRLIDFDFGGDTARTTIKYPEGYRPALEDGGRVGTGGQEIEKWHDWYALAYLLFILHRLVYPAGVDRLLKDEFDEASNNLQLALLYGESPTDAMIEELKSIRTKLTDAGVTCVLLRRFKQALDE